MNIISDGWLKWERYHLTPVGMAIIKKARDDKCWWGCGEEGVRAHCACSLTTKTKSAVKEEGLISDRIKTLFKSQVYMD